jgi:hypothetical protein
MAARKNRGTLENPWDDNVRLKIKTSMLINRLQDHVLDVVDLKPTQVQAALGLLKKTIPDLSQAEIQHTHKHDAHDYSRDELLALLAQARQRNDNLGAIAANGRDDEPDIIH